MSTKVLHLSSFDTSGGAARAAYRIHQGLQKIGIDSEMLVQFRSSNNRTVIAAENKLSTKLRSIADLLIWKVNTPTARLFSPQWFPDAIAAKVAQINPDIINLNWVCNSFLQIETLAKFNKPLIWTLQDMWSFTGGCHYSEGCDRYQSSCGNCPQLHSNQENDLSRWVWQRKVKAWKDLNLTIVAPSIWMADCAKASALFQGLRVEVIPFALDTQRFKPADLRAARDLLNLPQDKQLVLFGAINATGDPRKGFHLLQAALKRLSQDGWGDRIELVIFGSSEPENPIDLGFKAHYLGSLQDDLSLRIAYVAADVMIAPSIEEAFGQTASESLACGTPVVVFNDTGLQDIVDHQENGYTAEHGDTEDLARGIAWVLEDQERHHVLQKNARKKAEQTYALEIQAHQYVNLLTQILKT
ncbi:glycosyltransferase family 4 protein [Phormidium sp. CLA17]|uniref:glycosyltransferase family 4 protein n=1 Tax=Leptolyngbya sp. Cla-17 TaxID=2803751 RepID=UPI00149321B4|nr:glycosyltransferase family 4 protein [Leptolyngbya sp. Cla-17]MBM0744664.1 glycosyltransferase family 4 protein [Leptolyngbya sp. Cla-17]